MADADKILAAFPPAAYSRRVRLKYGPTKSIIDQTVLCNQACSFCWRSDDTKVSAATEAAPHTFMPMAQYRRIVDALAGVDQVVGLTLSGPMGDPLLVPDLPARGRYARDTGRFTGHVAINTNGVSLDRHDPGELADGFSRIVVSMDAVDPAIYDQIHGRTGQLPRILAGIDRLMAARDATKTRIKVRFTETDQNREHWPDFERYFRARVDGIVRKREHSFLDVISRHGDNIGARLCSQPYKTINFNYRGELTTCCVNYGLSPTFGTLDDGDLRSLWEGDAYEDWRRRRLADICKGCSGIGAYAQRIGRGLSRSDFERLAFIERVGEAQAYTS